MSSMSYRRGMGLVLILGLSFATLRAEEPTQQPGRQPTPNREESTPPADRLELSIHVGDSCGGAVRLLELIHHLHGDVTPLSFDYDSSSGDLRITGPRAIVQKLGREVKAERVESEPRRTMVVRVFRLEHAFAGQAIGTIEALHRTSRSPWVAVADPSSNAITVKGDPRDVEEAAEVITQLDRPRPQGLDTVRAERVVINHVQAAELAILMNRAAKSMAVEVDVLADVQTNSLLLVGPETGLDRVRELVAMFDVELTQPARTS